MPDLENLLNIEDEVTQVLSDLGVTAKLDEMDDFMNQNDLKVSITNESNAATTGLVTYTCTVKDKDNTALANRVVEWYKGTTLLGLDATDSNGISTFNHKVTEADIFDVHAFVRGTHSIKSSLIITPSLIKPILSQTFETSLSTCEEYKIVVPFSFS